MPVLLGGSSHLPPNNRLGAIGDSITTPVGTGEIGLKLYTNPQGAFLGYAQVLPKTGETIATGKLRPGPVKAFTGNAISDLLNTRLPELLAEDLRPGLCCVLGGTNDLGTMTSQAAIDAKLTDLANIYRQLKNARILPIACGLPTCELYAGLYRTRVIAFNPQVETLATSMKIPFVDFFDVTDNGVDGWIANYDAGDGLHPSSLGAAAMGQLLRDTIDSWLLSYAPPLVTTADQASMLLTNGCFTVDTNGDGYPDNWAIANGGAEVTASLVAGGSEVDGNWFRFNKTVYTVESRVRANINSAFTVGARYGFGFRIKVDSADQATEIICEGYNPSNSNQKFFGVTMGDLRGPLGVWTFYCESIAPSVSCRIDLHTNAGLADVYIGQFTVRAL